MLTDERVIFLRRLCREKGTLDYKFYANEFEVTVKTIGKAVRGAFYKHLNAIEPPARIQKGKPKLREAVRHAYGVEKLSHAIILERFHISSSTLSLWCRDLTKNKTTYLSKEEYEVKKTKARKLYRSGKTTPVVARLVGISRRTVEKYCVDLIQQRKADKRAASNIRQQRKPRVPVVKGPRIRKPLSDEQRAQKQANARTLREAIVAADRYEAWANAGFPDWGEPL
jgi:hypothetical protein